jgi:transcriptional regulator with XRE-family HTH domain
MQIISPAQCRAARALLNWSQPELAERCDIHVQTISNFEKESSTPSKTTLEKITSIFIFSGIVFGEDNGVRLTKNMISVFEGPQSNHRFMENLFNDMKDKAGQEVLIYGLTQWGEDNEEEVSFARRHIEKLLHAGVSRRLLVKEGYTNFMNPIECYRYLPKKYFPNAAFQLYGNKLALREWGTDAKIVVIEDALFAATFRKMFEMAWDNCIPAQKVVQRK